MKWPLSAKVTIISLLIALFGLLALYLWLRFAPPPKSNYDPTLHPVTEAPAPKPIARVRRVKTPPPKEIKAYNPVEVAGKLDMPELSFTDNTLVLDVATIPSHTADTTAVATLSPGGTGKILYRQEKPPFFKMKREWGVRAGFGTGGLVQGEIFARPLRVGPVEVEVRGYGNNRDFGGLILFEMRFQ